MFSKIKKLSHFNFLTGFTVLEIVIYIALLGVMAVFVTNFLLETVSAYSRAKAEREVISNARLLLETVSKSVSEAQDIYDPTSSFYANLGQLSLITSTNAEAHHPTTYVDFWVDGGIMYMRQEGSATTTLSSTSVTVSKFRLERIMQGLGRQAVKITLEVDYAQNRYPASTTIYSTIALRGNY